jgi:flagellar biosynthesis/type III secretory pathway protein FliH
MSKRKNPVLDKVRKEGYENGFQIGFEAGERMGAQKAIDFFISKLEGLPDVPGIGPETIKKIKKQIGNQYFGEGEYEND